MSSGRGDLIPVKNTGRLRVTALTIRAGLRSMSLSHVGRSGVLTCPRDPGAQTKCLRLNVTISRTPVICTLEEYHDELGLVRTKTGRAAVVINSKLTPSQRAVVKQLLAERRGAFANNEEDGIAKDSRMTSILFIGTL